MSLWQDTRFAGRRLVHARGQSALAVATFAIGLGSATAIYSVVDALLVQPLPYANAAGIVQVVSHRMEGTQPVRTATLSRPYFVALRERSRSLSQVGGYDSFSNVTRRRLALTHASGQGVAELLGTRVSPALLSLLGTPPLLGRIFEPAEERPGHNDCVILAERAWRAHFAGDPQLLGKSLRLDGRAYTVIGVLPAGFAFPDRQTDFWIPLTPALPPPPSAPRSDSPNTYYADGVFGRLADGVTRQRAAAEIEAILRAVDLELAAERRHTPEQAGYPRSMPRRAEIVSMQDELTAPARPLLRLLLFAVACVLLISCTNVVNLLLAGAAARRRDTATRIALGASRLRLAREALAQGVLLSLAGGLLGIPLAYATLHLITRLAPGDLPRLHEASLNPRLLLYGFGLSCLTGIGAGLLPALGGARREQRIDALLRQGASAAISASGFAGFGLRRLLVVGETALAVMLLIGAGLLLRSFAALRGVDLGYDARGVVAFQVAAPPERELIADFYAELLHRFEAVPGIEAVGATDALPLAGAGSYRFALSGLPETPASGDVMRMRLVSPGYFRALGVRLLAGRPFSESGGAREIVLAQGLVRRYFAGRNPIGAVVRQGLDEYVVVGVVSDVRHQGPRDEIRPEYYVDLRFSGLVAATRPYFVVRSARRAHELLPAIRAAVRGLDPEAALSGSLAEMAEMAAESVSRPRFNAALVSAFAAVAILLAAVALYGVLAHAVSERSREIGVRVALGARRSDVLRLVLRQTAQMAGAGLLLGMAGASVLSGLVQAMLFGVTPLDLRTLLAVPAALAAVAALASCAPALRATRIDPAAVLRGE